MNIAPWGICFDELRPCIVIDGPLDRFAWIEVTGLPVIAWNVTSTDRLLLVHGRIIGFDQINL